VRWGTRRELALDLVLMLALQALATAVLWPLAVKHGWTGIVIDLVATPVILFRRVIPLSALGLMLLGTTGLAVLGHWAPEIMDSLAPERSDAWLLIALPFIVYSALVYGADQRRAVLMIGMIIVIAARPWDPDPIARTFGVLVFMLVPAFLGHFVAGLNDRVERAERDQHRLAEQARVEERIRLAAEMHDVVTHRISLMVLQAGALGVTASDAGTRAAAEDLRAAGCQALEELRDLVGVLRSSPGEVTEDPALPRAGGQAGAPDFAELLAESESVGVPVTCECEGDPRSASPVVARTAYRIVQEALTNVRKHAPGADVVVRLNYSQDRIRLTVRNSAPGRRPDDDLTASGSGTGLLGLRQRVELVSGTLRTGPTSDGGFEVDATLPAYVPTRDERTAGREATSVEPGPVGPIGRLGVAAGSASHGRRGQGES
jgi:signal transduction histidine kinase